MRPSGGDVGAKRIAPREGGTTRFGLGSALPWPPPWLAVDSGPTPDYPGGWRLGVLASTTTS